MVKVWPFLNALIGLTILCLSIHAADPIDCGDFTIKKLPKEDDVNELKEADKEKCDNIDTGDINKNKYRYAILEHLNSIRSRISVGCGQQKDAYHRLPEAMNMLRVSYSCAAEKAAAEEAAKCNPIAANGTHPEYNVIGFNDPKKDEKRVDNSYYRAIHSVYNYLKNNDNYTFNPNTMLPEGKWVPHGAKLAAAALSAHIEKIGCAYKVCPGKDGEHSHTVVCFTEPKINMTVTLPPLYEPGASCAYDEECTASGYDKCDRYLMLCTNADDEDGLGDWSGASSYSIMLAISAVVMVGLLERFGI